MLGYFGKLLELRSANGGRFEINQRLFADDTALVADSEEKKLCKLISELGRVCENLYLMYVRVKLWGPRGMVMWVECM